jgi:UDP-glucuronate 4-epimerase
MKILVTGAAGFIGYHLSKELAANKENELVGIDNLNDYYDVQLKHERLKALVPFENFKFIKMDLVDKPAIDELFATEKFDIVINLAAQAGVRYSIENPYAYLESNLHGFLNILEACRHNPVQHLLYASSSSVYGGNKKIPFSTDDNVDHPVSLYAATKKSNELMAHTYSNLYNIPTTGLRFFTVYGEFGRPDMAYFGFTNSILAGEEIKVFNHGKMMRDFTYVRDVVEGISRLIDKAPTVNPEWGEENDSTSTSWAPYKIYNIGNHSPVPLLEFIETIEKHLGIEAKKVFMDMQPGDVVATYADVDDFMKDIDFKPDTTLDEGIGNFIKWYKEYNSVQ